MQSLLPAALLAAFFLLSTPGVVAQENVSVPDFAETPEATRAPDQPQQQPPGLPGEPTQVPVNGALVLLALAGGAYAVRRLRDGAS